MDEPKALAWRKTRYSIGNGDCVEVAATRGSIAVRDSKNTGGPVVEYSLGAWQGFLAATKSDTFDSNFYS